MIINKFTTKHCVLQNQNIINITQDASINSNIMLTPTKPKVDLMVFCTGLFNIFLMHRGIYIIALKEM